MKFAKASLIRLKETHKYRKSDAFYDPENVIIKAEWIAVSIKTFALKTPVKGGSNRVKKVCPFETHIME